MEEKLLLTTIPLDQFYSEIRKIIESVVSESKSAEQPEPLNHYLTRKEVCGLLRISLPTLHEWTKRSIIKSYRIGNKVFYKSGDIEDAMKLRQFSFFRPK